MGNSDEVQVYRIGPWRRGIFAGIGLIFMIPMFVGALITREAGLAVGGVVFLLIWAPCYWLVHSARLILSAEGVQFRQFGYNLASPWENVVRLWLIKGQQGFELSRPMENYSAKLLAGTAETRITMQGVPMDFVPGEHRKGLVVDRKFIPAEAFAYYFDRGNLLADIRRYAPQIADDPLRDADLVATATETDQKPMGIAGWVALGSIVAVALTLGILMGTNSVPENVQRGAVTVIEGLIFLALGAYGVVNIVSSYNYARTGRWGRAALTAVFALLQVLICLAILGNGLK